MSPEVEMLHKLDKRVSNALEDLKKSYPGIETFHFTACVSAFFIKTGLSLAFRNGVSKDSIRQGVEEVLEKWR